jgi:hypothetical protein
MSPIVLFLLMAAAISLVGAAIFLDHEGYPRPAIGVALAGLTCFGVMMCTAGEVDWGNRPPPSPSPTPSAPARPLPSYDPEKCIELQWLDARWTCIPIDEAG